MLVWRIHSTEFGPFTVGYWWLEKDGQSISPLVPDVAPIAEVDYYAKGQKIDRTIRTFAVCQSEYRTIGHNAKFGVECNCKDGHEVMIKAAHGVIPFAEFEKAVTL